MNPATERGTNGGRSLRKALWRMAATALAGGLICGTLVLFSPGFGLDEKQLDPTLSGETKAALLHRHDQERHLLRFYATYLGGMLRGDLGNSSAFGRPIHELLAERTPVTAGLMLWGLAGAWVLASALAIPAAACRAPWLSSVCAVLSGVPACIPAAGIAILLFRLGGSPRWMIALVIFPKVYQYLHSLLRRSYAMPHIVLARAKGLRNHRILLRHVLAPARGPLLALAAVSINLAFGAAVAIEAITDVPGLGQLAWKAAAARDLPVLVILTLAITLVTQLSSLTADLCGPAWGSRA